MFWNDNEYRMIGDVHALSKTIFEWDLIEVTIISG